MSSAADCPVRDHMSDASTTWRHGGPPDYTLVNELYLKERTRRHKADSLEKLVENLVKTWEMEASHKVLAKDWRTVNPDVYTISANGGQKFDMAEVIAKGTYNMLMSDSPLYDATRPVDDAHHLFKTCFPGGFAWELLDLYVGPPKVTFSWRHWAHWTGPYCDRAPTNEVLEMEGMCIATVDDKLAIEELQIYYDANPFIAKMLGIGPGELAAASGCPVVKKLAESKKE